MIVPRETMNESHSKQINYKDFELELKDYFLTQEDFVLKKNSEFGFLETFPQPIENLDKYYESENYISHSDSSKSISDKIYQFVKNFNIKHKFTMLGNPAKRTELLDYGCGAGDFLAFAKSKNLEVLGVEPNEKARKIAQEKVGENSVTNSELKNISEQFDIITLWHVLEHIPDLLEFIKELNSHLKPNGKIFIAVPNHQSFDAKFYKKYWAAYDVPRHLWHFSPKSLEKLFNSFGMKIEKRHALWFDSFYVSLLSEKYKKSSLGIFRAVLIATLSNLLGFFDGNYSSVVYQITKKRK